jgi:hypothetical protein
MRHLSRSLLCAATLAASSLSCADTTGPSSIGDLPFDMTFMPSTMNGRTVPFVVSTDGDTCMTLALGSLVNLRQNGTFTLVVKQAELCDGESVSGQGIDVVGTYTKSGDLITLTTTDGQVITAEFNPPVKTPTSYGSGGLTFVANGDSLYSAQSTGELLD